jgi:hypothetical protein
MRRMATILFVDDYRGVMFSGYCGVPCRRLAPTSERERFDLRLGQPTSSF